MPNLGQATYSLVVDAARMRTGMVQASRDVNTFTGRLSNSFNRVGANMQRLGRDMTLFVTGPLALFAKSSVDVLEDFQDTMQKTAGIAEIGVKRVNGQLRQLTGPALQKQISQVGDRAIDMGLKFGVGARDMAEGLYFISSAGFRARDSMKILQEAAQLSAGGLGDMEDISLALVGAIQAYGKNADFAAKASDTLSMAVRRGVMEADALAKVIGVVMGPARDAGVEFDEVSGAIALMTRSAIPAARAATSLRSILMRFQDPTEEVSAALKKMGINAAQVRRMMEEDNQQFDFIRENLAGLEGASKSAQQGFGGLTNTLFALKLALEDNNIRAAELFDSIRAQPGFNAIVASAHSANEVMGATGKAFDQVGNAADQAERAFEIMRKSLGFVTRRMQAFVEMVQIQVGRILEPLVRKFAKRVVGLADAFDALSDKEKEQVVRIGAIVAAVGPLLFVTGTLIRVVRHLIGGPLALLLTGAVGIGGAMTAAAIGSEEFRDKVTALSKTFSQQLKKGLEAVRDLWERLLPKIQEAGRDIFPKVRELIKDIGEFFVTATRESGPFFETLLDIARVVLPPLVDGFRMLLGIIKGIVDLLGGAVIARLAAFGAAAAGIARASRMIGGLGTATATKTLGLLSLLGLRRPPGAAGGAAGGGLPPGTSPGGGGAPWAFRAPATAAASGAGPKPWLLATPALTQMYPTGLGRDASGQIVGRAGVQAAMAAQYRSRPSGPLPVNPMAGGTGLINQVGGNLERTFFTPLRRGVVDRLYGAGSTVVSGMRSMVGGLRSAVVGLASPMNLLFVAGVSLVSALAAQKQWAEEVTDLTADTAQSLTSGNVGLSDIRDQISNLEQESRSYGAGAIFMDVITNPVKSALQAFTDEDHLRHFQIDDEVKALEDAVFEYLGDAAIKIQDALGAHMFLAGGQGLASFVGHRRPGEIGRELIGMVEAEQLTLPQAEQIAALTGQYKDLAGGLRVLNFEAVEMFVNAGMMDEATGLLETATARVTKEFWREVKAIGLSTQVMKDWKETMTGAIGLTERQRKILLVTLDALKANDVQLGIGKTQLLEASIKTGDFAGALAILRKALDEPGRGLKDLVRNLGDLPQKAQQQLRQFFRRSRGEIQGFEATSGKMGVLERLLYGGPQEHFDPSKARTIEDLLDMFRKTGSDLGKITAENLRDALKTQNWDAAIAVLYRRIQDSPKLRRQLNLFRTHNLLDPTALEFETNLQAVWEDYRLLVKNIDGDILPELRFQTNFDELSRQWYRTLDGWLGSPIDIAMRITEKKVSAADISKLHSGGKVKGSGDVPAVLQAGEFVVRRSAAETFGPMLENINKFHDGGWVGNGGINIAAGQVRDSVTDMIRETAKGVAGYIDNNRNGVGGYSGDLVRIGRQLQQQGFLVGEHPAFGGVAGVHTTNSWHYRRSALDINWPGENESGKLKSLYHRLKSTPGLVELFHDGLGIPVPIGGHEGHLHFAMTGEGGPGGGGTGRRKINAGRFGSGLNVEIGVDGVKKMLRRAGQTSGDDGTPGAPADPTGAAALGKRLAAARGWKGRQWDALYNLWMKESGWNYQAANPASSARGIPQAMMSVHFGSNWTSNPEAQKWLSSPRQQINWGLDYISNRYKTPAAAWDFWQKNNWYGDGGITTRATLAGVGEKGREAILPLDSQAGRSALKRAMGSENEALVKTLKNLTEALEAAGDGSGQPIVLQIDSNEVARVHARKELLRRRG